MKYQILIALTFSIVQNAEAQKVDDSKIPATVKKSFTQKYPGISNIKWEKEKGNYEAGFKKDGATMSILFTPGGTMIESETDINILQLPSTVTSYVKEHYKGKNISEAAKIVKANGELNFEAEVDHKDLIFDANGKFLKVEKD